MKNLSKAPDVVKSAAENLITYSPAPTANSLKQSKTEIEHEKKQAEKLAAQKAKQEAKSQAVKSKSGTPVLSAGVGTVKFATPPDIRTSVVTKPATTNVKLAESYYIRGLQKCILRDMQGAVADLDKAIANNSKYADAFFYRAAIKKELGDIDGFKADYKTAIQINPALQSQYNESDTLALIR